VTYVSETFEQVAILLIALVMAAIVGLLGLIWVHKERKQRRLREHFRAKKTVTPRHPPAP
jgi:ABC-type proline/glycine betaine transport system permease subunit